MSAINLHPPQTYSRLFRPWDTSRSSNCSMSSSSVSSNSSSSRSSSSSSSDSSSSNEAFVKIERCSPPAAAAATATATPSAIASIKREQKLITCRDTNRETDNEAEQECASKSSSHIGYTDILLNNIPPKPIDSPLQVSMGHESPLQDAAAFAASQLYNAAALEHHQMQMMAAAAGIPQASELYYAAAAAAAAASGLNSPTTNATANANFGMDPYTLGLMEQEYARVMAEDAHLKAMNARKQRPKKFKCPHCDVAFSNNGQLKGHIRIHTGERPFKCDVDTCGKTFTRNEELTRHKRIHTGLRPYPCSACGKKFGRRDHLKKHMKTHMPQERQLGPAIFVPMYPYLYGY